MITLRRGKPFSAFWYFMTLTISNWRDGSDVVLFLGLALALSEAVIGNVEMPHNMLVLVFSKPGATICERWVAENFFGESNLKVIESVNIVLALVAHCASSFHHIGYLEIWWISIFVISAVSRTVVPSTRRVMNVAVIRELFKG